MSHFSSQLISNLEERGVCILFFRTEVSKLFIPEPDMKIVCVYDANCYRPHANNEGVGGD